jgi:hydroxyacylglutathione hydrolase
MKIVTLPCSFDNYAYLIICEQTGVAAVVDPAEFYPVFCALESAGVTLRAVFCSHHHADHIGGLEDLLGEFPGLKIYGYGGDTQRIPGINSPLTAGSTVRVGNLEGRVLHTPGHTSGSLCYLFEDHLFTGDTLFGAGCGRLFEGTPKQMYEALNLTIKKMPAATKVHFGHEYTAHNLKFAHFVEPGNQEVARRLELVTAARASGQPTTPSTLATEIATNPFLRCEEQELVRTVAEKFFGEVLDPLSVFTVLRRQKDGF